MAVATIPAPFRRFSDEWRLSGQADEDIFAISVICRNSTF
jgi:hypothetical protein